MNKVKSNCLWRWTHFLGSALVFVLVLSSFWSLGWMSAGGAYNGYAANELELVVSSSPVFAYFNTNFAALLPITRLVGFIFDGIGNDGALLYSFAFGFDVVIWFNVMLYAVQAILFLPAWVSNFLGDKVNDGRRKF